MKFHLTTSGAYYTLDQQKQLAQLGFTFRPLKGSERAEICAPIKVHVDIPNIEALLAFVHAWGRIIVTHDPPTIEIYDDYRE